jgi:UDP-N-acetylmuramoylalanine--D-glutamate ligase
MDEYTEAKKNIYGSARCRRLVTNLDNEITRDILENESLDGIKKIAFSRVENNCGNADGMLYLEHGNVILREGVCETVLLDTAKIKLPGTHNVENYMAAAGAVYGLGFDEEDFVSVLRETAAEFGGVEHRLEFVSTLDGVDYYNSSIDSSPTRTAAALRAFNDKSIVICGGYDKHIPFEPLAEVLCEKASFVVLCGATAQAIKEALDAHPAFAESGLEYALESDFVRAVERAREAAGEGERVVLSPACASFDMFRNFEERGRRFKEIVNSLK